MTLDSAFFMNNLPAPTAQQVYADAYLAVYRGMVQWDKYKAGHAPTGTPPKPKKVHKRVQALLAGSQLGGRNAVR